MKVENSIFKIKSSICQSPKALDRRTEKKKNKLDAVNDIDNMNSFDSGTINNGGVRNTFYDGLIDSKKEIQLSCSPVKKGRRNFINQADST